jgi:hypothetical protein
VRKVDVPLVGLQIVAFMVVFSDGRILSTSIEKFIVGEQRRLTRTHVSKDHAGLLVTRIGGMANLVSMLAASGLPRLIQAAPLNIVEPAVVDAAEPAVLDATVTQIRASVGAMEAEEAGASLVVTKEDELFAEQLDSERCPLWRQLVHEGGRLPVAPHKLPAGRAATGLSQQIVFFLRHGSPHFLPT